MLRVALVVVLFAIGALAAPYCANVTRDELSFCFAVDYKVYFGDGETPTQLDRLAQTLYLGQHDFGIEGGCNTEARDLICANIFRQCNETTADTPLPTSLRPCRKLCKDFKSCFKVEGDCDEFTYEEAEGECTNVKSDASVARVAFLAIVAVFLALMW